jgi:hypothetical protein
MSLLETVDRYGAAIEYDLRHELHGVELLDFFRGRRSGRQLARYLSQLPPSSRYVIAQRNDPVVALAVARDARERQASGAGGRYRPPAVEWDTGTELLASLVDRMGEAVALLADMPVGTKGGKRKTKPPKQVARPETAIERAERQLSEEHVLGIMADVEASYVSEDEYARIAADVEARRQAEAVHSSADGPPDGARG